MLLAVWLTPHRWSPTGAMHGTRIRFIQTRAMAATRVTLERAISDEAAARVRLNTIVRSATLLPVRLTDHTLSCAAGAFVPKFERHVACRQ